MATRFFQDFSNPQEKSSESLQDPDQIYQGSFPETSKISPRGTSMSQNGTKEILVISEISFFENLATAGFREASIKKKKTRHAAKKH